MEARRGTAAGDVDPADEIETLDRRLAHVLEPEMRRKLVLESIQAFPVDAARALIRRVHDRRPARTPGSDHLRDIFLELLLGTGLVGAEPLSYEFRRDLYEAAAQAEDTVLMELLRSHPEHDDEEMGAARLPKELEELPLGLRRSLAKGTDPQRIEQLARDSDAQVIRNLLRNPRLREEDVVRMAALRPVALSTLLEIARSPRWSNHTRVRVALVRNPRCPVEMGMKLLGVIPMASLREMRRDPDLPERVKRYLEREIERRSASTELEQGGQHDEVAEDGDHHPHGE